jgi:8-oxo-dGTP pyrophosphatase MutT (NUDIX family)
MSNPPLEMGERLRARMLANLTDFDHKAHTSAEADPALRSAAVNLIITDDEEGQPCFVITRRTSKLRSHPGQWALPGGRVDTGETLIEAALRETREEVGLDLPESSVLGFLDDYPTRSGYRISPIVMWAGSGAELTANPAEVARVYRVPLAVLDAPEVPRLRNIPESPRPVISIPIAMLDANVHAPTAAILYQLREVAIRGLPTRVSHFEQPVFAWR